MKKLLILLTICINTAYAGSGAGGIIKFVNDTKYDVEVIWNGVGCAGASYGIYYACEVAVIGKQKEDTYKYNWGVTTTWLTIAKYPGYNLNMHACAPSISDNEKDCLFEDGSIDTYGWKTVVCKLTESKANNKDFNLNCERE